MDIYEVVKKITGPIKPIGEPSKDAQRYENLENLLELTDKLLVDIRRVAREHNNRRAGGLAQHFLEQMRKELEDAVS